MTKYAEIGKLTNKFLSGKLQKLTVDYSDSNHMKVSVLYADSYDFFYDYDLEINQEDKACNFIGHQSKSPLFKLNLDREQNFEKAVFDYLYSL